MPTAASTTPSLLKEELRLIYQLEDPSEVPSSCQLGSPRRVARSSAFVKLARTSREHRDGILAVIRLGLSNARLEGLNSKVRLVSHRSLGFHSAAPLIALIYLCCGGLEIDLVVR